MKTFTAVLLLPLAIAIIVSMSFAQSSLTDSAALTRATQVFGPEARTAVVRVSGSNRLTRCVGYQAYGVPRLTCVIGSWEDAFNAVPPPKALPVTAFGFNLSTHIGCLSDTSQEPRIVNGPFGPMPYPDPVRNCEARMYSALVEVRSLDAPRFDAILAAKDLWLQALPLR